MKKEIQILNEADHIRKRSGMFDLILNNLVFFDMVSMKSNTQQFIKKAVEKHGDRYDYSLVDYINNCTKVKIICKEHGIFEQIPTNHLLKGNGCRRCHINKTKLTTKEFIERANKIHENEYDYSLVDYINTETKIKIICKEHGEFEQTPHRHLAGDGCKKCGMIKLKDNSHNRLSQEEFIKKANLIHNYRYDYSLVDYKNARTKIEIICKNHGKFEQKPKDHLHQRQGCPQCPTFISKPHQKVVNYLIEKELKEHEDFIINDRSLISPFELDIYVIRPAIAIEIDGEYWHGKLDRCRQNKDYIKSREDRKNKRCEEKKIKLLRFTDKEINKDFEKVKEKINNCL